jgi:hypothetical protein
MPRVILVALALATASAALAESTRFKSTDCGRVEVDDECEWPFKPLSPERQKALIQELKKQQEDLLELDKTRKAGVKSDGSADPKKNEPDSKKK